MLNGPQKQSESELLTFVVCGSVDDGKSTLIGRLLYDSKSIFEDQLDALRASRSGHGQDEDELELAHLTDGLRAEREQGITIDVAYRYFATPQRRFIIADTPGHVEYTRNMVTGASNASLALILVNARKGVVEQTRRHAYLSSLLGIRQFVVCINKMDLVDYSQDRFQQIQNDFLAFSSRLRVPHITFVPLSALRGDNVVHKSETMPWYDGPSLISLLETAPVSGLRPVGELSLLPIQLVILSKKADGEGPLRLFAGQIAEGELNSGDEVLILPGPKSTRIRDLQIGGQSIQSARAPESVAVVLEDELDVGRGELLLRPLRQGAPEPRVSRDLVASLCWMQKPPLDPQRRYLLKHTTRTVQAFVAELYAGIDINSLESRQITTLNMNEIGKVRIKVSEPLAFSSYGESRKLGAFILIDPVSHATAGVGMIIGDPSEPGVESAIDQMNWEI